MVRPKVWPIQEFLPFGIRGIKPGQKGFREVTRKKISFRKFRKTWKLLPLAGVKGPWGEMDPGEPFFGGFRRRGKKRGIMVAPIYE